MHTMIRRLSRVGMGHRGSRDDSHGGGHEHAPRVQRQTTDVDVDVDRAILKRANRRGAASAPHPSAMAS